MDAHLNDTPGNLAKLLFALDLVRASATLRRDADAAEAAPNASEEIRDKAFFESVTHVIADPAPADLAVQMAGAVSGWDALGYEFRQEQASTIGRLARELQDALYALDDFDTRVCAANATADNPALQRVRARLVDAAVYAVWHFVVHRECMGLRGTDEVLKDYVVPAEVRSKMGVMGRPR